MNAKLAFALSFVLVITTAGCSTMGRMFSGGSGSSEARGSVSPTMSAPAPVPVDPAGTATFGTGSVSRTGADQRMDTAAGIGLSN